MKWFCNACAFVEDTEDENHTEVEGGLCLLCGDDNFLQVGDIVEGLEGKRTEIIELVGSNSLGSIKLKDGSTLVKAKFLALQIT